MTDQQLLLLFQNASRKLSENKAPEAASRALVAIQQEWRKRTPRGHSTSSREKSPAVGMLASLGYHVGTANGCTSVLRRLILKHVLEGEPPLVDSFAYSEQWGPANSAKRYVKLIQFLQSQLTNPANCDKTRAIIEWVEDLEWVQHNYAHLADQGPAR